MIEHSSAQHIDICTQLLNLAEPILPPELEQRRGNISVVDSLVIKGHPSATNETNLQKDYIDGNEFRKFEVLTTPHTLLTMETHPSTRLRLLDKIYPHGLLEIMPIQSCDLIKPSVCDLDEDTQRLSYKIMQEFSSYSQGEGLYPYIAWSFDPKTKDRESGQGVKRFHAHLIGRTPEEMSFITVNKVPLRQVDNLRARRLVDETSIVGSFILYDMLKNGKFKSMEIVQPFSGELSPSPNIMLRLKNGWSTLSNEDFRIDFNTVHARLLQGYEEVMGSLWSGQSDIWIRPTVNDTNTISDSLRKLPYLEDKTIDLIMHVVRRTQPTILRKSTTLSQPEFRDIATHLYPLAGPCYSTSICEINDDVYCTVRPYMFSDLGGAGLSNPYGIVTKVRKGMGLMDESDMDKRRQFQNQFVERISSIL